MRRYRRDPTRATCPSDKMRVAHLVAAHVPAAVPATAAAAAIAVAAATRYEWGQHHLPTNCRDITARARWAALPGAQLVIMLHVIQSVVIVVASSPHSRHRGGGGLSEPVSSTSRQVAILANGTGGGPHPPQLPCAGGIPGRQPGDRPLQESFAIALSPNPPNRRSRVPKQPQGGTKEQTTIALRNQDETWELLHVTDRHPSGP